MRFSYIALSPEYQKLTGVISAKDEADARKQLHSMGLSVISIEKTDEEPTGVVLDQGIKTYYFKVIDNKGKEMDGTIDSDSRKTAYRRLVGEYQFKVLLLCDASLPVEARDQNGKEGLGKLAEEIEEEYGITQSTSVKRSDDDLMEQSEEFIAKKVEVLEEVNNVSKKAELIMEKYAEKLSGEEVHRIRYNLNNLMRIRLSNNLRHIKELVEKLFNTIDDIVQQHAFEEEEALNTSEKENEKSEALYKENLEKKGLILKIKFISKKFTDLLTGKYKKSKSRKKGIASEFAEAKKQARKNEAKIFILLSKIFKYGKKALLAKSKTERKENIDQLKKAIDIFKKAREERELAKKMGILDEEIIKLDELTIEHSKEIESQPSLFFREARLFTGWLLGLYTIYFFVAFYTKFKWGESSPVYSFIEKSLQTSFLYAFVGILFFVFLAFSLKIRYAKSSILKSIFVFLSTFFLMIIFLLNF